MDDIPSKMKNVLVTGGAGFLGSVIVRKLLQRNPGLHVTVLDKSIDLDKQQSPRLQYHQVDITIAEDVSTVFRATNPDAIIHAAGMIPPQSERYRRRLEKAVFNVNVDGTRNVLDAAKEVGCKAFVYTSSCCAVTDDLSSTFANIDETWPIPAVSSIYGQSKVQAEKLVLTAQTPNFAVCILRPSVFFGEGDVQLIPSIHACIANGETSYVIGNGTNLWDVDYVGNVADAHVLALDNLFGSRTASGEIFFIQIGEPVPFRDLCLQIWKHFEHFPSTEIKIPESLALSMGLISEWYGWLFNKPTTLSRGSVKDACAIRYASSSKAQRILGHRPQVGLEEALRISCQVFH